MTETARPQQQQPSRTSPNKVEDPALVSKSATLPKVASVDEGTVTFSEFMQHCGQRRKQLTQEAISHKNQMIKLQTEMKKLQEEFAKHEEGLRKKEAEMKGLDKEELLKLQERTEELKKKTTSTSWGLPQNLGNWP
ncbi:hypothetical protein ACA910_019647 [Epithemia clementina (nom. ined.)]